MLLVPFRLHNRLNRFIEIMHSSRLELSPGKTPPHEATQQRLSEPCSGTPGATAQCFTKRGIKPGEPASCGSVWRRQNFFGTPGAARLPLVPNGETGLSPTVGATPKGQANEVLATRSWTAIDDH